MYIPYSLYGNSWKLGATIIIMSCLVESVPGDYCTDLILFDIVASVICKFRVDLGTY